MTDANFWHERWRKNEIPFHERKANPLLVKYFARLALRKGARVFVPLCGKTRDISWLLARGCRVVGAELSEIAIGQLFAELKLQPKITVLKNGRQKHYSAKGIDVFVGDVFDLTKQSVGRIDAVYDRAALVALPEEMRKRYTALLKRITNGAPQLLITYDYDQSVMPGPPFSISNAELVQHYAKSFDLVLLTSALVPGGLKGKCAAIENLWLLKTPAR